MPKKFSGQNEKAVAAKERKEATKQAAAEVSKKKAEDALWVDDDKNAKKKADRAREEEEKRRQAAEKKAQLKMLQEQEEAAIAQASKKPVSAKKSVAEIEAAREAAARASAAARVKPGVVVEHHAAWESANPNHQSRAMQEAAERSGAEVLEARDLDSAVRMLSSEPVTPDAHPEKRMKAAFKAYQERMLPIVRSENPGLKLTQLNERIFKMWQSAPENPKLQAAMAAASLDDL